MKGVIAKSKDELLVIEVLDRGLLVEGKGEEAVKRRAFLPLNPTSVTFSSAKVYNVVQTSSPMRYVVLDWGIEMPEISVEAQTGRILPFDSVYTKITKEYKDVTYEDLISAGVPIGVIQEGEIQDITFLGIRARRSFQEALGAYGGSVMWHFNYGKPEEISKFRYLMMKLLEDIFKKYNANFEILRMRWMRNTYYGLMVNFNYTISVESLWNIKFRFVFRQFPKFELITEISKVNEGVIMT